MAQSVTDNTGNDGPSRKVIGVVTLLLLFVLLVAIASGLGSGLIMLGLIVFGVGAFALVRGRATWARIVSRRAAVAVVVAGFVAMGLGSALDPTPKTDNTASQVAAPTSSAAPTTSAPKTTSAAPKPLVAAPVTTTSAAPVLPPAPVMTITCPTGGSVASPVYGQQITATAPYTVAITYGDGDQYSNDDQHLAGIFSHTYKTAGTFAVAAVLTDAVGQTTSATCSYTWTKPVQAAVGGSGSGAASGGGTSVSGSGGSTGGSVSGTGGALYYQNCDAVRAAGAAPIRPGDPGFQPKFDRDDDGVGCE